MCRSRQCLESENTKVLEPRECEAGMDGWWGAICCEQTRTRLKRPEALVLHMFLGFTRKMCSKGLYLGLS